MAGFAKEIKGRYYRPDLQISPVEQVAQVAAAVLALGSIVTSVQTKRHEQRHRSATRRMG